MATNLPSCFSIEFLEQLLKFLANFTLLKYVKSQRSYGFLITKELIFGFQILDLNDHFSASLKVKSSKRFSCCVIRLSNNLADNIFHWGNVLTAVCKMQRPFYLSEAQFSVPERYHNLLQGVH